MITEQDLAEAIAECEGQRNPNANTCLKLAAFYIIRDKMFHVEHEPNFYSMQSKEQKMTEEKVEHKENESKVRQALVEMEKNDIINLMDELMNTLQVISPRLYDTVVRKLTASF